MLLPSAVTARCELLLVGEMRLDLTHFQNGWCKRLDPDDGVEKWITGNVISGYVDG